MNFLKIIWVLVLLVSCNNEKKTEQKDVTEEISKSPIRKIENIKGTSNYVKVIVTIRAEKNDYFQLFYNQDYMVNFNEKESLNFNFKGSVEFQKITFKFQKNVFPVKYRFDISENQNQNKIEIKSLSISIDEKEIFIPEGRIMEFLIPNNCINYNFESHFFQLSSNEMIYDPYFTCSAKLIALIAEL